MNKRGISPLISVVLIIGLVIVLAVIINIFISNIVGEQIDDAEEKVSQLTLLNFDVSGDNVYGRSIVKISNNEAEDLSFALKFDGGYITENTLVPAYSTRFFNFTGFSESVQVTPIKEGLLWILRGNLRI
jgi:flagellin-like protein